MGGELVPCQVKKTAPRGILWALHATEDPLSRALQRLFQIVSLDTRVNAVALPAGNRRVLGIVLLPELLYPLQVLRCRRRWRWWRRRERPRHSHLLDDALKASRGDEEQRPGRLRRRVPPGVQRPLGDVEDRTGFRHEGALAVQDFQLPIKEAIGFVRAVVDVRRWLGPRQGNQFHQRELPAGVPAPRLDSDELVVRYPERVTFG